MGSRSLVSFPKYWIMCPLKPATGFILASDLGLHLSSVNYFSGSTEGPEKEWQGWNASSLPRWFFPVWLEKLGVEQWSGHLWGGKPNCTISPEKLEDEYFRGEYLLGKNMTRKLGFLLFSVFQKGHPTDQSCKQGSLPTRLWWWGAMWSFTARCTVMPSLTSSGWSTWKSMAASMDPMGPHMSQCWRLVHVPPSHPLGRPAVSSPGGILCFLGGTQQKCSESNIPNSSVCQR